MLFRSVCPVCLCVKSLPAARCDAIQRLLNPVEVAHLVDHEAARWTWRLQGRTFTEAVADWLRARRADKSLSWRPDPVDCDRWCSPRETLANRGGDCDDFAILAASLLLAGGVDAKVVTGNHCQAQCGGHAWVEGYDERGWFLLEATNGVLHRRARPVEYHAELMLGVGLCHRAA